MKLILENKKKLSLLCKKHKVKKLYLFGSFSTGKQNELSDMDFLVSFDFRDLKNYFSNYISFKEKLKKLFKREIDIIEEQTLRNPVLIKSINKNKELIYG